jgi:4-diphosphocytidyl-2-C-methyl-D-erythritol kinase
MRGRGELVEQIDGIKAPLWLLLLCPEGSVSAGEAYRKYDELGWRSYGAMKTQRAINALRQGDLTALGGALCNDLYAASALLESSVQKTLTEAASFSPLGATMTGSGSAVVALFETKELCDWAKSRYRGKAKAFVVRTVNKGVGSDGGWLFPFALRKDEIQEEE